MNSLRQDYRTRGAPRQSNWRFVRHTWDKNPAWSSSQSAL